MFHLKLPSARASPQLREPDNSGTFVSFHFSYPSQALIELASKLLPLGSPNSRTALAIGQHLLPGGIASSLFDDPGGKIALGLLRRFQVEATLRFPRTERLH
jgi:hypothetical protein